jgi:hypothetical protein
MRSCSNVISDNNRADKTADLHPTYTLIACLLFFLLLFQFENDENLCATRARERIMAKKLVDYAKDPASQPNATVRMQREQWRFWDWLCMVSPCFFFFLVLAGAVPVVDNP